MADGDAEHGQPALRSVYTERRALAAGAVLWTRAPAAARPPAGPPGASGALDLVLPDGCMDLLWTPGALLVAGPDTHAFRAGPGAGAPWAGVRFFPGTAPALLGTPAHELRDRRVPLDALWPTARVRELTERVDAAADPAAALDALAMRQAARAAPPDPLLGRVVAALTAGRSVGHVCAATGLGERTLRRRAHHAFGYGPKTLARVLRLQRALALARGGEPHASTAVRAGYADQAHLARDVRALTGLTLTELTAGRAVRPRDDGPGGGM